MPVRVMEGKATEPRVIAAAAGAEWDRFVGAVDGATFCHLSGWRQVMADALGHETLLLAAVDEEGRWEGVLPLVRLRSLLFGHSLVSMPFLNDGGPLGTARARERLVRHAVAEARSSGAGLLELRAREPVPGLASVERRVAVHLPLPGTPEELWEKTFRAKLRSQIRKPQKEGMETRFGPDQVGPFYRVFSRNMRDLGTPVHPRAFFERIADSFPGEAIFGAVYHRGAPVAAAAGFLYRGEFEITWASALREHNRLAPNMLLYSAFMEEVIRRGAHTFNFGRCAPGGPTHRFKLQWGGHDVPLPWAQWPESESGEAASADRPLFHLATRVWQRMPLPVANRLGPVLARRIPWF